MTKKATQFCQALAIAPHNPTEAAIKAGYAPQLANAIASKLMRRPEIQAFVKTLPTAQKKQTTENYDWKLEKLKQIVASFIPTENTNLEAKEVTVAIQAISEMNKMQGHYAAEKHVTMNVNVDSDIEKLETLIKKYRKDY